MQCNIAFYIHHHGAGHIMRCLAVADCMHDCNITFFGSNLQPYRHLIPGSIKCIDLPMDVVIDNDNYYTQTDNPEGLHYAPLHVRGQRERTAILTAFFRDNYPLLLVVDVSAEVAMLARLCGIPAIIVRQHGNRTDPPHTLAYKNAYGLLAPYPDSMQPQEEGWLSNKTFFAGGLSRYSTHSFDESVNNNVVIIAGSGGTSINSGLITHIATACPGWQFTVLGLIDISGVISPDNVEYKGQVNKPVKYINNCTIVIGNAGHNTVMEVAALYKRFIVIPEERPFEEQEVKAKILHDSKLATVVTVPELYTINWHIILQQSLKSKPCWEGFVINKAAANAANYLIDCYNEIYSEALN